MRGEARIHIDAPADAVYAMVSDVTRMGEWSPETYACEWLDGARGPAVGARFRGRNRHGALRWATRPRVVAADPGREFAFDTGTTVWRYRFEPRDGGTEVIESYETKFGLTDPVMKLLRRDRSLETGMVETLRRIKAAAERG